MVTAPAIDHPGHTHDEPRFVPDQRPRGRRLGAPAAVAGILFGASVALHLRDPHRSGSWGGCPWLAVTGTDCPGCGGLRAVNDLTNLRLVDAASSNLFLVSSLPFVAFYFMRWVRDRWVGVQRLSMGSAALTRTWVVTGVGVVWWISRNLPGLEWLRSGF